MVVARSRSRPVPSLAQLHCLLGRETMRRFSLLLALCLLAGSLAARQKPADWDDEVDGKWEAPSEEETLEAPTVNVGTGGSSGGPGMSTAGASVPPPPPPVQRSSPEPLGTSRRLLDLTAVMLLAGAVPVAGARRMEEHICDGAYHAARLGVLSGHRLPLTSAPSRLSCTLCRPAFGRSSTVTT